MTSAIGAALILLYAFGLVAYLICGVSAFIAGLIEGDQDYLRTGTRFIVVSPLWPVLAYQRYQSVMRQP